MKAEMMGLMFWLMMWVWWCTPRDAACGGCCETLLLMRALIFMLPLVRFIAFDPESSACLLPLTLLLLLLLRLLLAEEYAIRAKMIASTTTTELVNINLTPLSSSLIPIPLVPQSLKSPPPNNSPLK
jgi:hypothetical protein